MVSYKQERMCYMGKGPQLFLLLEKQTTLKYQFLPTPCKYKNIKIVHTPQILIMAMGLEIISFKMAMRFKLSEIGYMRA